MPLLPSLLRRLAPMIVAVVALGHAMAPELARAQSNTLTLAVSQDLDEAGLARHLAPRFGLRANTRVTVLAAAPNDLAAHLRAGDVDVVIAESPVLAALADEGLVRTPVAAFRSGGETPRGYGLARPPDGPNDARAAAFEDWLTGTVGHNAITGFGDGTAYLPGAILVERPAIIAIPDGDAAAGAELALSHCGRCHRIDARNRFGGLSNSPSFGALRSQDAWLDKFSAFWSLNPHPSFTQIAGVTPPFDPERPPSAYPVMLTPDELDAIIAFAATVEPLNLGAPIQSR